MRLSMPKLPSTTTMTTNVTEATVRWTHWLIGLGRKLPPDDMRALFGRAKTTGARVSAFAVGAVGGGVSAIRMGSVGLLAPICALVLLAARPVTVHQAEATATAYQPKAPDPIHDTRPETANSKE
jgi:uncharacterized membrane protein YoaK (UPF0700 family)